MGNPKRQLSTVRFESDQDHPQFVSAAARSLAILRCYDYGEQYLGNREIALRTGLPKPTVSRLTFTLCSLGYLNYSRAREKYALGAVLLSLGNTYNRCNPVIAQARPLMQRFAEETESAVMLGAHDGMRMILLAIAGGDGCPDLALEPGTRVPHGLTALGRADLAARRPDLFQRELRELSLHCRPFEWPAIRDGILRARSDVTEHGYCYSLGDWREDIYAVGVPLVGQDPERVLALSCGGPAASMSHQRLREEIGPRLIRLRDQILATCRGQI
ncbi:MAG: IclR family transcriptional regulator [Xanthomonadales bacterium]|nr:IclR family transcriptional regulator [Xanthomonadales bacterium]